MTEIALNPAANAALAPTSQAVVDLQMWASELSAAHSIGRALASTDFVPASLKTHSGGRPKELDQVAENVAACILAGKALGLDPMNSIQNIFVVHGRPAMYARTMAALVLAAGHEIERVAATEQRVEYRARRAGSTTWQSFAWDIARASKAGYLTNAKYKSDPIAMLTAKCQAEAARVIAPDVLTGIASTSVEEVQLEDLGETETAATPAVVESKPKVQRARRQAPAPVAPAAVQDAPRDETPVDPEEDAQAEQVNTETGEIPAETEAQPEEAACTPEQQKALGEALKAAGYGTKAVMMTKVTDMLGRGVESSKELTETEAIDLTARLWEEADAAQPDTEPAA
jgi:hypothetical protein